MNKFIILFIAGSIASLSLKGQEPCIDTGMTDIYTSMGNQVNTWITCEETIHNRLTWDAERANSSGQNH
jgi:hypothetical protein